MRAGGCVVVVVCVCVGGGGWEGGKSHRGTDLTREDGLPGIRYPGVARQLIIRLAS